MSVSASAGRRRRPPPGRYPFRRRFPAAPATSLRRVDRARETPGFRLDRRRRRAPRGLRDRPELQAPPRGRASHVSRPGDGGGRVAGRRAVVGGVRGPHSEGIDPGSVAQQLRRPDRRRACAGGAGQFPRLPIGALSVARLRRRRVVWLTLVRDVAQAYFELLALDVRLEIARNSTDAYQRTYNVFQDRFRFGTASKLETSRAEGALGEAQATIPQLESDIVAKENQIGILLGKSPAPVPRGTPMYAQAVVPTVPAGLPSTLLERRPDLRQAEQQLVSANARVGVAKAEFLPKLSLTALFGTASPEVSALTGGTATIWAVAGMLSGPVFNAGRTLGSYRASIAQWEQARLQYEQAVLTALREVSDALAALAKLSEAETGQDRAVKALEEAFGHAKIG